MIADNTSRSNRVLGMQGWRSGEGWRNANYLQVVITAKDGPATGSGRVMSTLISAFAALGKGRLTPTDELLGPW
jgi:hypothetical protein